MGIGSRHILNTDYPQQQAFTLDTILSNKHILNTIVSDKYLNIILSNKYLLYTLFSCKMSLLYTNFSNKH